MQKKKHQQIPKFKTYQEEQAFWKTHDVVDYLDLSRQKGLRYQGNLTEQLTVRFSTDDLLELRKLALKNKKSLAAFIRTKIRDYLRKQREQSKV